MSYFLSEGYSARWSNTRARGWRAFAHVRVFPQLCNIYVLLEGGLLHCQVIGL